MSKFEKPKFKKRTVNLKLIFNEKVTVSFYNIENPKIYNKK